MDNNIKELDLSDFNPAIDLKKKKSTKKEFVLSEEMKELAQKIINEKRLDTHPAKIEYILVYPSISSTVAGKCLKSSKELKFFSNFDYVIEISGDLWDTLDKETKAILLEHELRHILVVQNDKTGDWNFKIRPHDVMDFEKIISAYGIEWFKKLKLIVSALYNLSPAEEDNIQL